MGSCVPEACDLTVSCDWVIMWSASSIRLCFSALYLASSFAYSERSCRRNPAVASQAVCEAHITGVGLRHGTRTDALAVVYALKHACKNGKKHLGEEVVVGASRCGERDSRRGSTRRRENRRHVWRARHSDRRRCCCGCGSDRRLRWHGAFVACLAVTITILRAHQRVPSRQTQRRWRWSW